MLPTKDITSGCDSTYFGVVLESWSLVRIFLGVLYVFWSLRVLYEIVRMSGLFWSLGALESQNSGCDCT
jgi:hypothetical protein